jgi:hypothetical protein
MANSCDSSATSRHPVWAWCGVALFICGCQSSRSSTSTGAPPPAAAYTSNALVPLLPVAGQPAATATPPTASADDAVHSDATVVRLDDIVGDLLLYFQRHRNMPATLEDLLAEFPALNITAPSGQPYVYYPQGLTTPNIPKLLVVFDPAETQRGSRWCILVNPLRPGSPLTAEVKELPEVIVSSYRVSAEQK